MSFSIVWKELGFLLFFLSGSLYKNGVIYHGSNWFLCFHVTLCDSHITSLLLLCPEKPEFDSSFPNDNKSSLIDSVSLISRKSAHFSPPHLTCIHSNHCHFSPSPLHRPSEEPRFIFVSIPLSTSQPDWSSWSASCIIDSPARTWIVRIIQVKFLTAGPGTCPFRFIAQGQAPGHLPCFPICTYFYCPFMLAIPNSVVGAFYFTLLSPATHACISCTRKAFFQYSSNLLPSEAQFLISAP